MTNRCDDLPVGHIKYEVTNRHLEKVVGLPVIKVTCPVNSVQPSAMPKFVMLTLKEPHPPTNKARLIDDEDKSSDDASFPLQV